MTDSKLVSRGKAVGGKAWNAVSSKVGDVYQAAAKAYPGPSNAGRVYRSLDKALATDYSKARAGRKPLSAREVMAGGAIKRREEDAGL
jgi:hypothetical protein